MASIYTDILYLEGEKYFLKPLPGKPGQTSEQKDYAVVDTAGFVSYYIRGGQLLPGNEEPAKKFGFVPSLVYEEQKTVSLKRWARLFAPDNQIQPVGWVIHNTHNDQPVDETAPILTVNHVEQNGRTAVINGNIEDGVEMTATLETQNEKRKLTFDRNKSTFSLSIPNVEPNGKIVLVAKDDAGNEKVESFEIRGGIVVHQERWDEERKKYLTLLAQLIKQGYEIKPDFQTIYCTDLDQKDAGLSTTSTLFTNIWSNYFRLYEPNNKGPSETIFPFPLFITFYMTQAQKKYYPATLASETTIPINPLSLQVESAPQGKRIRLINFIDGKILMDETFVFQGNASSPFFDPRDLPVHQQFATAMVTALNAFQAQYKQPGFLQAQLEVNLPRDIPQPVSLYEINTGKAPSTSDSQHWQGLTAQFENQVSIKALPDGGSIDEMIISGNLDSIDSKVKLDLNMSGRMIQPLQINGQLRNITFGTVYPEEEHPADVSLEKSNDRYGNRIVINKKSGNIIGFEINLPSRFESETSGPSYKPVRVELPKTLGNYYQGPLPPLLWERVKYPKTSSGPYTIYSDWDAARYRRITPHLPAMVDRAKQIEGEFGIKPGTAIKRFYLVNSQEKNAHIEKQFPETVWIWSKIANRIIEGDDPTYHEGLHAIDMKYKISSEGPFKEFFDELKLAAMKSKTQNTAQAGQYQQNVPNTSSMAPLVSPLDASQFFKLTNESNAFPKAVGGHSLDNNTECFASLLRGVLDFDKPAFHEKFVDMPVSLRKLYARAYRSAAESIKLKLPKAPLIAKLNAAATQLEKGFSQPG